MRQFLVERTKAVTAKEIVDLRDAAGRDGESEAIWQKCIDQSMCVVTARDKQTGDLIGVALVAGNVRHAELCDGIVKPDWRETGVGGAVLEELIAFVREEQIMYVGLTFDTKSPWLKDFYGRHGFVPIDFAMWHGDSIRRVRGSD